MLELGSVLLPVVTARIDRFIAEGGKGPYPDMESVGLGFGERTRLACWFESLAVASRPLQRRLAETNLILSADSLRPNSHRFKNHRSNAGTSASMELLRSAT